MPRRKKPVVGGFLAPATAWTLAVGPRRHTRITPSPSIDIVSSIDIVFFALLRSSRSPIGAMP